MMKLSLMIVLVLGLVALTTPSWAGNTQQKIESTVSELENISKELELEKIKFTKLFMLQTAREKEVRRLAKERTSILEYVQRQLDAYTLDCVNQFDDDTMLSCSEKIKDLQQYKQNNNQKLINMLKKGIKIKIQYIKTNKELMATIERIQVKADYQMFLQEKLDILRAK